MFSKVIKKVFGTKQGRDLKLLLPIVDQVSALEPTMKQMSDEQLKAQTPKLKERLAAGESSDEILVEAYATVREAAQRVLGLRPYDVQITGAIVMHQGKIAEMKTGEGKTLTATMALYLNALSGQGAHLVTVNDYLASRDAQEMGELYNWLGLTVGTIVENLSDEERKEAYSCDITYGTNNEFAFDYLRDNMKFDLSQYVQREHNFCIVDEVDSILIDEARTPLLISGPSESNTELYQVVNQVIPKLVKDEHFTVDEKSNSAVMTEEGIIKIQEIMNIDNLYDVRNVEILHHVNQSLRAHNLFEVDSQYIVRDGQVIIVDEFTGRLKEGSRWSDGLHQAIEAKEGVAVKSENQTLASITFQNYFNMYTKLSGMTGTADTEAEEFHKIYQLDVVVVPTNVPIIRDDRADVIYATKKAKYLAVAEMIKEAHKNKQPVLVGTITVDSSEILSKYLTQAGIAHEVLNAKQHEREADIVANAGKPGSVTIATNMAGRGTDIKLNDESKAAGGLFIIGTERHESRRIDNQLRGRSGRQGDPGTSKFFLSLEDDLMRIFGSDKIKAIMTRLGLKEDEPIEHSMISNNIAKAQKRVEGHNFEIRKHLLDFDNVMHEQRKVIYKIRKDILNDEANFELFNEMSEDVAEFIQENNRPAKKVPLADWSWDEIEKTFQVMFNNQKTLSINDCTAEFDGNIQEYLSKLADSVFHEKFDQYDQESVALTLREVLLSTFDSFWKDHLLSMDQLKEGINLRSYGQKDPLVEYKREAFHLYEVMKQEIRRAVVERMHSIKLYTQEEIQEIKKQQEAELEAQMEAHRRRSQAEEAAKQPIQREGKKIGRNDPCPCGSGKKFKHCHGA